MQKSIIEEVEKALRFHINYTGESTNRYLKIMDRLTYHYKRAPADKVCALLDEYFREVSVDSLEEAFDRLRKIDKETL